MKLRGLITLSLISAGLLGATFHAWEWNWVIGAAVGVAVICAAFVVKPSTSPTNT